jgi:ribosomal-protein-alanine N-acetyltransferase
MKIPFLKPQPATAFGPLRPGDAASAARLHAASFARGWSISEIEALVTDPGIMADALYQKTELIAFVLSRIAGLEAEILTITVYKSARGAGLGRKLLGNHIARLAASGIKELFLEVEESNAAAKALYQRLEFVKIGQRAAYYPKPDGTKANALILQKRLIH